jgi:hypothetical protein
MSHRVAEWRKQHDGGGEWLEWRRPVQVFVIVEKGSVDDQIWQVWENWTIRKLQANELMLKI